MVYAFTSEWATALARWTGFISAAVLVGVVVTRMLPGLANHREQLPAYARTAAAGALVAAIVRVLQQALLFAASPGEAPAMVPVLLQTPWGMAWLAQVGAALVVRFKPDVFVRERGVGALLALIASGAPAFQGHAIGSERLTGFAVLADVLHLVASGVWMGTLATLVPTVLRSTDRARAARDAILAFSPMALKAAVVLGITGVFSAWLHVTPIPALWQSQYGLMLVRKLVVVALIAVIGAVNWKKLTPSLLDPGGVDRMRRSAKRELVLGAIAFLLTAFLVATPLPGE